MIYNSTLHILEHLYIYYQAVACGFAHTGQFANHLSKQLVKTSKQKSHEHHEQPVFHPASSYVRVVPLPLAYKKATERGKESKHEQT